MNGSVDKNNRSQSSAISSDVMDTRISNGYINSISIAVEPPPSQSEPSGSSAGLVIPSEICKAIFPPQPRASVLNILGGIIPLLSILQFGISIFIICEYKTRRTYYYKFLIASVLSLAGGLFASHGSRNTVKYLQYIFASELFSTVAAIISGFAVETGLTAIHQANQDCYPGGCSDIIKESGSCEPGCVTSYSTTYWILVYLTAITGSINILLFFTSGVHIFKSLNEWSRNRKRNIIATPSETVATNSTVNNLYANSQNNSACNLIIN